MRRSAKNMPSVEARLRAFLERHALLRGVSRLGIAVSGGADSIALLHLLAPVCRERGIVAVILHFDHHIRGTASTLDTDFVRSQAAALGLEFTGGEAHGVHAGGGRSLEMAARDARHAFFRGAMRDLSLDAIATGHQADDVAETLLMRLLRGAGATGLSGLKPVSNRPSADGDGPALRFVRPLLLFRRDELRVWLSDHGLPWREDETNADTAISRNKVRHVLLPELARHLPGGREAAVDALAQSANILREEDAFLDGLASAWLAAHPGPAGAELDLGALAREPLALARRVARLWLRHAAGEEAAGLDTTEALLGLADGGALTLPGAHGGAPSLSRDPDVDGSGHARAAAGRRVLRSGGLAVLEDPANAPCGDGPVDLPCPGAVEWNGFCISASPGAGVVRDHAALGEWPAECSLSLHAIAGRMLHVRARRPGDRIAPLGIDGTKKVQDVFTDGKLPAHLRDLHPLVFCGDELVWIPGYRVAAAFAVHIGDPCAHICVDRL